MINVGTKTRVLWRHERVQGFAHPLNDSYPPRDARRVDAPSGPSEPSLGAVPPSVPRPRPPGVPEPRLDLLLVRESLRWAWEPLRWMWEKAEYPRLGTAVARERLLFAPKRDPLGREVSPRSASPLLLLLLFPLGPEVLVEAECPCRRNEAALSLVLPGQTRPDSLAREVLLRHPDSRSAAAVPPVPVVVVAVVGVDVAGVVVGRGAAVDIAVGVVVGCGGSAVGVVGVVVGRDAAVDIVVGVVVGCGGSVVGVVGVVGAVGVADVANVAVDVADVVNVAVDVAAVDAAAVDAAAVVDAAAAAVHVVVVDVAVVSAVLLGVVAVAVSFFVPSDFFASAAAVAAAAAAVVAVVQAAAAGAPVPAVRAVAVVPVA